MELNLNLNLTIENEKAVAKATRVKKAVEKKKASAFQPTWEQVWITGYPTTTGKHKNGIFQAKISDSDRAKLVEVKKAVE